MLARFEKSVKEFFDSPENSSSSTRKRKLEIDVELPPEKRRRHQLPTGATGIVSWFASKLTAVTSYLFPPTEEVMYQPQRPSTPIPTMASTPVPKYPNPSAPVGPLFDRTIFRPPLPRPPATVRRSRQHMAAKECIRLEERSQYAALIESFVTQENTPRKVTPSIQRAQLLPQLRPTVAPNPPVAKLPVVLDPDLEIVHVDIPPRVRSPSEIRLRAALATKSNVDTAWSDALINRFNASIRHRNREVREAQLRLDYLQDKRNDMALDLEKKIRDKLTLSERIKPAVEELSFLEESEEEEEEELMRALTNDEESKVLSIMNIGRDDEVMVQGLKLAGSLTRRDLRTLKGLNWLNDEVINAYMSLLMERSETANEQVPSVYAFSTFFYLKLQSQGHSGVRRWTKRANVDIFSKDLIIIPIHLGMHWCLSVIDIANKAITYYDSMGGENTRCLAILLNYLESESQEKLNKQLDTSGWSLCHAENIPLQMNGSDCGVFTCQFAQCASRRLRIGFTQQDMPYFRKRMVVEILNKQLF